MTTSTCYSSIQLCGMRVAKLTSVGAPMTGAGNGYVTDATIKLDVAVEVEAGIELTQKNGCGVLCAVFKQPDRIKRLNLAFDLCQLDSELLVVSTGAAPFRSGGITVGAQLPAVTGSDPSPVCIEAWSKAWDGDAHAVNAVSTPDATYIHWVFPFVRCTQGNMSLAETIMVVPVTGICSENDEITANGPFDDWPAYVSAAGGVTRLAGWFLDDAPPTAACASIAVTSAAS